jgi:hypothetical protein
VIVDIAQCRRLLRKQQQPMDEFRVTPEIRPLLGEPPDQLILEQKPSRREKRVVVPTAWRSAWKASISDRLFEEASARDGERAERPTLYRRLISGIPGARRGR